MKVFMKQKKSNQFSGDFARRKETMMQCTGGTKDFDRGSGIILLNIMAWLRSSYSRL